MHSVAHALVGDADLPHPARQRGAALLDSFGRMGYARGLEAGRLVGDTGMRRLGRRCGVALDPDTVIAAWLEENET
jgi:hypothetical protein